MKSSEEAACEGTACQFSFSTTVPTITQIAKEWDALNNKWTIKVTGTDITGTKETTELLINGVAQTTTGVVPNQALFTVSDVADGNL